MIKSKRLLGCAIVFALGLLVALLLEFWQVRLLLIGFIVVLGLKDVWTGRVDVFELFETQKSRKTSAREPVTDYTTGPY